MESMPVIPESTKTSLAQRLRAHARANWPQLAEIHVRFRGQFAYVAGELADGEQMPSICTAVDNYGAKSMNRGLRYWLFPILTFKKGQHRRCYRIIKCNNIHINGPACCFERPSSLPAKTCLTWNPCYPILEFLPCVRFAILY